MGKEHASRRRQQRGRDARLVLVDVEPGGAERPALERGGERLGIDQRAAGGVDEDAAGPDQLELGRPDQVAGLRRRRRVKADHLRGLEQLAELAVAGADPLRLRLRPRAAVEDLGAERPDQLGVATPDSAEADHSNGRPAQLDPPVRGRVPAAPAAGAEVALGVAHSPGSRQGQRQGELGRRLGQDTWGIGDEHSPLRTCREVDVVVADREVGDNPELAAAGVEELGVDGDRGSATSAAAPGTSSRSCSRVVSSPPSRTS